MRTLCFYLLLLWTLFSSIAAVRLRLNDARTLQGEIAPISRVDEKVEAEGSSQVKSIYVVDDGLRRIYLPKKMVTATFPDQSAFEVFKFKQRYANADFDARYESLGDCRIEGPFDVFGRRTVSLNSSQGPVYEVQSITEINSRYVRTRGLKRIWDARYALNSIPRSVLTPILKQQIDPTLFEERIRLFQFYVGAEYYEAAEEELESILEDFQSDPRLQEELRPAQKRIRQMSAERLKNEFEMRSAAGQYQFVEQLLRAFKTEGVSGMILQDIRRLLDRLEQFPLKRDALLLRMQDLANTIEDERDRSNVEDLLDEMEAEMTLNTIDRLSGFQLSEKDTSLNSEEKLAMGLTGWLVGPDIENRRLIVALSLAETRELIRKYLLENDPTLRQNLFVAIQQQEAGTPELVAALLKWMRPPISTPVFDTERPGYYELETKGMAESPFYHTLKYSVQLPPEYDPNRSYPVIVSLHSATSTPNSQLTFWSGNWSGNRRFGQATRFGYIVVAPQWSIPGQRSYDGSPLVHGVVLNVLRDVARRFHVDTDRVFLTGHGIGGEAAWDIGLAHPDLWAGIMPFCAQSNRIIETYNENARFVPFYYVGGELETGTAKGVQNKLILNGKCFNYYLRNHFNATVVLYLGRGPELYHEELLSLFAWMKTKQRTIPAEFTVKAIRPLNSFYFFWNVELSHLPDSANWPNNKGVPKSLEISSSYSDKSNRLKVLTKGISQLKPELFLTPEMVNFGQRVEIEVNNKKYGPRNGFLEPDMRVILEDARTRVDRLHPFWVRLDGTQ